MSIVKLSLPFSPAAVEDLRQRLREHDVLSPVAFNDQSSDQRHRSQTGEIVTPNEPL